MKNLALLSLLSVVFTGCAAFNKFDVRQAKVDAPEGKSSVTVAGVDEREYLKKGQITDDYLGMARSGMGIPYWIKTATKQPLALEVAQIVSEDLSKNRKVHPHFSTHDHGIALQKLKATGADRWIVVRIKEWESENLIRTSVWKDVIVEVYNKQGKLLASAQSEGEVALGGNFFVPSMHARKAVLRELGTTLTSLLNQPNIVAALK